jgi:transcriptional regulator with XRE-family HTH domain
VKAEGRFFFLSTYERQGHRRSAKPGATMQVGKRFTSHALDEMAKDGITQAEALGILRGGVVEPGEFIKSTWRYRMQVRRALVKPDALERTIATELLKKPALLCGAEVTFFRNCLAMKGRQLAKELGIQHETLSRYENDFCRMNPTVDRLLRAMVALWYLDRGAETFTAETAANISPPTGDPKPLKLTVYFDPQGVWRKAAA